MQPENIITPLPSNNQSVPNPTATLPPSITGTPETSTSTGAGADIRIDNVNRSLWQYIKQRKSRQLILLASMVIAWDAFVIYLYVKYLQASSNSGSSRGSGFGYLIAAPFVVFFSWIYRVRKQFEDAFLEEFAAANNYSFSKRGSVDEAYGTIFRLIGDQRVSDIVSGTYAGNSLRLFLYELTVGSGRSRRRYADTVIEIDLHGQLPNLLMVNKKSHYGQLDLASSFGIKNTFTLEGDFNSYFTLYGEPMNQVEAYEVFSPDIMALMEDESQHYTVEFSGNRIYIYANGFISTTKDLTRVFALAKKLIDKIAPLASRLQNDSAMIATPVNIIQARQRHPILTVIGTGIAIVFCVIGFGVGQSTLTTAKPSSYGIGEGAPTTSDITMAASVSNEFMQDLGHNNISGAEQLESLHLQEDTKQNQYLRSVNWQGVETSTIIDQASGTNNVGGWIGLVYENETGGRPLYIKLGLYKYGSDWRIWFFQTTFDRPSASL